MATFNNCAYYDFLHLMQYLHGAFHITDLQKRFNEEVRLSRFNNLEYKLFGSLDIRAFNFFKSPRLLDWIHANGALAQQPDFDIACPLINLDIFYAELVQYLQQASAQDYIFYPFFVILFECFLLTVLTEAPQLKDRHTHVFWPFYFTNPLRQSFRHEILHGRTASLRLLMRQVFGKLLRWQEYEHLLNTFLAQEPEQVHTIDLLQNPNSALITTQSNVILFAYDNAFEYPENLAKLQDLLLNDSIRYLRIDEDLDEPNTNISDDWRTAINTKMQQNRQAYHTTQIIYAALLSVQHAQTTNGPSYLRNSSLVWQRIHLFLS